MIAPSDRPTAPPTDAELEALAAFELMIKEAGEIDARYANVTAILDLELEHALASER
jgi:hypothetical protein